MKCMFDSLASRGFNNHTHPDSTRHLPPHKISNMQQETKRRKVVGTSQPEKQFVDGEADDDECSGNKRKNTLTATSSTDVSSEVVRVQSYYESPQGQEV